MRFLVYLLGVIGTVGSLIYSFSFSSNNHLIFIGSIIIAIGVYFGFYYFKNKKRFVIGCIVVDGILFLLPSTISCLSYIISVIIYKYREVSVYDFSFSTNYVFYDEPLLCLVTFLGVLIPLFLLAVIALDKKRYTLAIIALLPGVFIELLFTITPPWYFLSLFVLYILILLIGTLQKRPSLKLSMIIISIIAMSITYVAFPVSTYRPSKYSLFDNSRAPLATAGNIRDEYNVNDQGDRYYRNSIDFIINGETTLNNFKIRGIAYDLYDEGSWDTSHVRTDREWFQSNLEKIAKITKVSQQTIEVDQMSGYSQRNYTPYFIFNKDMSYYGSYYQGRNPQTYEMIIPNDDFNAVLSLSDVDAKIALLQELAIKNKTEEYCDGVFNYGSEDENELVKVPDDVGLIIDEFLSQHDVTNSGNIFDYINQCNQALAANTTYTLRPGNTPDGVEIVDYFLNSNRKGYCVHYATTLALMLRRQGYKARFAVGYQVPGTKNKAGKLVVKDSNGHAWVEIYDELLGWIPIEATPISTENPNTPTDTVTPTPSQNQPATPDLPTAPPEGRESTNNFGIPTYIYYLLSGGILVAGFFIQAKIRREHLFKNAITNNQRACFYYHYLKYLKIDCLEIKKLIDKARFSQYQLSDEELLIVEQFYQITTKQYYHQANIIKKVYLHYILAIM